MEKFPKEKMSLAIACLACTVVLWPYLDEFGASEFSGGWLTGSLLRMADLGSLLFLVALLLTLFLRRIAASIALAATLLYLPFYLYILSRELTDGFSRANTRFRSTDHFIGTTGRFLE